MSLMIIILSGVLLQFLANHLKIPSLLFFLVAGIVLGPFGLNLLSKTFLSYAFEMRNAALVIILLRAGLGLNISALKKVGRPALLMSCVPGILEGFSVALIAVVLLGVSFYEGGMLGFILAAVSPAVVVPMMLKLERMGLGVDKAIPSLILAGASIDDVVAITFFSVFSALYMGTGSSILVSFLMIPVRIILGILLGFCLGRVIARLKKVPSTGVLVLALVLSKIEMYVPIAALMAVMTLGFGISDGNQTASDSISSFLNKLWYFAQMVLFMLVGASFDPLLAREAGKVGFVIIIVGLCFRTLGVFLSLIKTNLTLKERVYCAIAYLPKATVQAAMGGVPLALGVGSGSMILAISVLAILFTTPLGALSMSFTSSRLLRKSA